MLNNNAELDNGVYNEPEEKKQETSLQEDQKPDDGLVGLNMQFENTSPVDDGLDSGPNSGPGTAL